MVHIQEVKDRGSRINRWQAAGRVTIYREEQLAAAHAALDGRGPVIHSAVKECARPHASLMPHTRCVATPRRPHCCPLLLRMADSVLFFVSPRTV